MEYKYDDTNINFFIGSASNLDKNYYIDMLFVCYQLGNYLIKKKNNYQDEMKFSEVVSNISNFYTGKGVTMVVLNFIKK